MSFMRPMITKKILRLTLIAVFATVSFCKNSEAVVPISTSFDNEENTDRQKLTEILQKIERHEKDDMDFLKDIKNEMKDLKNTAPSS